MITIIEGKMSTGKTYLLCKYAEKLSLGGVSFYCNVDPEIIRQYAPNLNFDFANKFDIKKLGPMWKEGHSLTILLDDAYFYLDSRRTTSRMNRELSQLLRSKQVSSLLTTQRLSMIDARVREGLSTLITCHEFNWETKKLTCQIRKIEDIVLEHADSEKVLEEEIPNGRNSTYRPLTRKI